MFISSCEGSQQKEPLSACLLLCGYGEIFSKDPRARRRAQPHGEKMFTARAHKKQFSASECFVFEFIYWCLGHHSNLRFSIVILYSALHIACSSCCGGEKGDAADPKQRDHAANNSLSDHGACDFSDQSLIAYWPTPVGTEYCCHQRSFFAYLRLYWRKLMRNF